jgi:outer membrane phospholipase A
MNTKILSCRAWLLAFVFLLLVSGPGTAAELLLLPAPTAIPAEPAAGMPVRFEVYGLNRETVPLPAAFPESLTCRITVKGSAQTLTARLAAPAAADAMVPPGAFARREYELPAGIMPAGPFQIELLPAPVPVPAVASRPKPDNRLNQMEEGIFRNFSPYETNYFVAGSEDPVIRFQLSFKFSVLGECAGAAVTDWLGRPYVAYSQISLWDWMERSSPFYDTSYKPELFMLKKDMPLRLPLVRSWDLQYGIQHESNGKGGDQSRSQNLAYIKPVFNFGNPDKFHLTLTPRLFHYIGDMSDNRDMHDYRGYGDLTAKLGWNDGLILSGLFRTGYEFVHNTVQVELSYPMYRLPGCSQISDNLFIFFQVFNGYGESLLDYNRQTTGIRAGFAISR